MPEVATDSGPRKFSARQQHLSNNNTGACLPGTPLSSGRRSAGAQGCRPASRSPPSALMDTQSTTPPPQADASEGLAAPALPAPTISDEALFLTDAPVPGRQLPQRRPLEDAAELWTETVTDWAQLAALESEWQELSGAAAEPNPFYEPWMLIPALRNFAATERIELLFVFAPHPTRAKGRRQLCGFFPMHYRRGRAELWHHKYCYLAAPLLRAGAERAVLRRWLDWLGARAALVRLEDAPGDGPVHLALVDELNRRGWPSLVTQSYTRAVLRRAASAEDYLLRALAGKRRKELRRQ